MVSCFEAFSQQNDELFKGGHLVWKNSHCARDFKIPKTLRKGGMLPIF